MKSSFAIKAILLFSGMFLIGLVSCSNPAQTTNHKDNVNQEFQKVQNFLVSDRLSQKFEITYPQPNEILNFSDFLIEGHGKEGDIITLSRGQKIIETLTILPNEYGWSFAITGKRLLSGKQTYTVFSTNENRNIRRTFIVKKNQPKASNATCPCKLRILITDEKGEILPNSATDFFFYGLEDKLLTVGNRYVFKGLTGYGSSHEFYSKAKGYYTSTYSIHVKAANFLQPVTLWTIKMNSNQITR